MNFSLKTLRAKFYMKATGVYTAEPLKTQITALLTNTYDEIFGEANIEIVGMPYEVMGALTELAFFEGEHLQNRVELYAIDAGSETLAYSGTILEATADFNSAPNPVFRVSAATSGEARNALIATSSFNAKDKVKLSDAVKTIAGKKGIAVENHMKNDIVVSGEFRGSAVAQIERMCMVNNVRFAMDFDGKIHLYPQDFSTSVLTKSLSSQNGLIGYPSLTSDGLNFRCAFCPALKPGVRVAINSVVPGASGMWLVGRVSHSLSSGGGLWETSVQAVYSSKS